MANNLKALAREIRKNRVKVPEIVHKLSKVEVQRTAKGWCGKHSGLAIDIDWMKVPHGGYFDKCKHDRGNNARLITAMARCGK